LIGGLASKPDTLGRLLTGVMGGTESIQESFDRIDSIDRIERLLLGSFGGPWIGVKSMLLILSSSTVTVN